MIQRHILATSGGYKYGHASVTLGPIIKYGLQLTGKDTPKMAHVGTASGDAAQWTARFYEACQDQSVKPSHLSLFPHPNVADVRAFIMSQDMIWVGGGSVANLLAVWRVHKLDEIFREAWKAGIVLAGQSAGSICWHVGGTTDSFGEDLQPVTNGLGLLPFSNGVHHDAHPQRKTLLHQLIEDGTLPEGYATEDGTALHFIGTELHQAITDTPGKYACRVTKTGETKLKMLVLQ